MVVKHDINRRHLYEKNKMFSYRRETALQGALVLAKSGRLEVGTGRQYLTDIIGLSSTTVI